MTQPQITYRGMPHSPAMDARIRELAARLDGAKSSPRTRSTRTPYIAITQAFDVVIRQLEDDVRRKRGEVKRHPEPRGDATP